MRPEKVKHKWWKKYSTMWGSNHSPIDSCELIMQLAHLLKSTIPALNHLGSYCRNCRMDPSYQGSSIFSQKKKKKKEKLDIFTIFSLSNISKCLILLIP